jgi:hypothetical protein
MNRKGFELSLNFLVVMIISIFILVGGITFTYKFLGHVDVREKEIDEQTKRQIESLLMDGHMVAIPIDTIKMKKGGYATFGLGIYNILKDGTTDFRVAISFKQAYDRNGNVIPESLDSDVIDFINDNWVFGQRDTEYTVQTNRYELIPISVSVGGDMSTTGKNTKAGKYEFNVCVCQCPSCTGDSYCLDKCNDPSNNRDFFYGKHVLKLYVDVPE